jgi:hypothetical protein
MGGTCGDLVATLLDPRDAGLDFVNRNIRLPAARQRLKKPYTFADDLEKDTYLDSMASIYSSVPSHALDYHVRRGHRFVAIRVRDPDIALWSSQRFQQGHRPEVWTSVAQSCDIETVEEYAQLMLDYGNMIASQTDRVLDLEDILAGTAIAKIENAIDGPLSEHSVNVYKNWLALQNGTWFL